MWKVTLKIVAKTLVYATAGGKDRIARKRLKTCRRTCRKINVAQDAVDNEFCDWMLGGLRCWLATQGFQPLDRTSVCRLMRSRMPAADGCTGPPVCSSHNIRMDHFKGGGSQAAWLAARLCAGALQRADGVGGASGRRKDGKSVIRRRKGVGLQGQDDDQPGVGTWAGADYGSVLGTMSGKPRRLASHSMSGSAVQSREKV